VSDLVVGLLLALLASFLVGGVLSLRRQGLTAGAVVCGLLALAATVGAALYLVPVALAR
jgi:hypothetical protein